MTFDKLIQQSYAQFLRDYFVSNHYPAHRTP